MLICGRRDAVLLIAALAAGCNSPADKLEDSRRTGQQLCNEGLASFAQKDFTTAEQKLTQAITQATLNPDTYSDVAVKRAVCLGAIGKADDAIAELQKLEAGAPNLDQIYAARSYVLAKQGKVAESRAALAKAKQFNRAVQEFKD